MVRVGAGEATMVVRKPNRLSAVVAGVLLSGSVAAAVPARAQGPEDFLNDVNGIGIGSRDDKHNSDLVELGHVICWRLYNGEGHGEMAAALVTGSRSDGGAGLSPQQVSAEVSFAVTDLCPGALRQ